MVSVWLVKAMSHVPARGGRLKHGGQWGSEAVEEGKSWVMSLGFGEKKNEEKSVENKSENQ
jgi:hypothetical protein